MTTSFPTSLDALTNPTGSSSLTSPDHAGQHADANDAIEALQTKVGVDGSAVTSSLDYMVAASKVVTDKIDPASASTNQVLKYNGTKFVPATGASVTVSDTPPTSPTPQAGDQWYESDTGRQLIYYDGFWVEIGSTATTNVNASDLSGTVLASNVVSSSLTSFGSSPVLAGTPTAPTASAGTNTTQVATTAFVTTANAVYSGQPLKIYSDQAALTQKVFAATNDTLNNIATYTTNPRATSYLLITVGVAYEYNTSSDVLTIGVSINGTDQFSFGDTTNTTTYNEFPYYTFRSINSYAASTVISNIRTYVKSASGNVVCPRTTGGPLNFSITIQEYAV